MSLILIERNGNEISIKLSWFVSFFSSEVDILGEDIVSYAHIVVS